MGEVIQLTAQDLHKTCYDCVNAYVNCYGQIFCACYSEMIVDEEVAFECVEYLRS